MKSNQFEDWLKTIVNTQDEEISCTECFDLISRYVELELAQEDPGVIMPQLKHHLSQCLACREEYEALRDLCHLEEQGKAIQFDDLQ
jgi:hypothetical protein